MPVRLALSYSWRFVLLEYRRWSPTISPEPSTYRRNEYLMYPFAAEAEARFSDSVAYIRVFPMLAHQARPDTLYPYYAYNLPVRVLHKRIPFVADRPDTTRQALLRLSFRVLSHSPNQD